MFSTSAYFTLTYAFAVVAVASTVVQIGQTVFQGSYDETTSVESFRGIRYGNAPRFQRGVRTVYGSEPATVNATFFGVGCPQVRLSQLAVDYGKYGTSEDCLVLDIYRPSGLSGNGTLPIMFWLHGGGLTSGAASTYPGFGMVEESVRINLPVIVVSINYRLASWGFLGGREVSANGAQNLGLYDQRDALQWVQDYIVHFGGDPSKVTVFGQSSGAMSAAYQMLDVDTTLFRAAILQSGTTTSVPALPADKYQNQYDALVGLVGCSSTADTFECIRTVDQDILQNATAKMSAMQSTYGSRPWGVTIDGEVIPGSPSVLTAHKRIANIPTITGNVRDEGTIFVQPQAIANTTDYITFLHDDYLGRNATFFNAENAPARTTLEALYSEDPAAGSPFTGGSNPYFGAQFKRAAATYGDLHFQGPRRHWLDVLGSMNLNTWSFQFETAIPGAAEWEGVYHTSDIPYVFMGIPSSIPSLYAFSQQVLAYWVSFAHNLDPSHPDHPAWPLYNTTSRNTMRLNSNGSDVMPDTYRQAETDLLQSIAEMFLESEV